METGSTRCLLEIEMSKILTDNEMRVLACLRANKEAAVETKSDGSKWSEVYLDNALPHGMSIREFDGTLGSLQRKGFYKDTGDCFGLIQVRGPEKQLSQSL